MKKQTKIGHDFGLDVVVSWYPPVTATNFVLTEYPPRKKSSVAWIDPKAMKVKLWQRGSWVSVANVIATRS